MAQIIDALILRFKAVRFWQSEIFIENTTYASRISIRDVNFRWIPFFFRRSLFWKTGFLHDKFSNFDLDLIPVNQWSISIISNIFINYFAEIDRFHEPESGYQTIFSKFYSILKSIFPLQQTRQIKHPGHLHSSHAKKHGLYFLRCVPP